MTDKLVHSRIEEIRTRLAAATPRPWRKSGHSSWTVVGPNDVPEKHWMMPGVTLDNFDRRADERVCSIYGPGNGNHASADFDFIVNAPADVAWLLDALDDEHIVAEDRLQTLNAARATPKDEARDAVQEAKGILEDFERRHITEGGSTIYTNDVADLLLAVHGLLNRAQGKNEAAPTVTGIPDDIADLVRSAFVAGMDRCREVREAYDEWPSLTGRVELADDYISTFTLLGPEPTEAEASATLDQADGEGARTVNRTATTGREVKE